MFLLQSKLNIFKTLTYWSTAADAEAYRLTLPDADNYFVTFNPFATSI